MNMSTPSPDIVQIIVDCIKSDIIYDKCIVPERQYCDCPYYDNGNCYRNEELETDK